MRSTREVRVKVKAGARKEKFEQTGEGVFAATVKEKAERGAANGRVRALVAAHFKVPVKAVRIISGAHSPGKLLSVLK